MFKNSFFFIVKSSHIYALDYLSYELTKVYRLTSAVIMKKSHIRNHFKRFF